MRMNESSVYGSVCISRMSWVSSVTRLRNQIDEEYLAEFDAMVARIENACDAALVDIAAQRKLASAEGINRKRSVLAKLREGAWEDGTPISPAFKACYLAPFVPWDDCGSGTDVPTVPGAWRQLAGSSRKLLLAHVLRLVET